MGEIKKFFPSQQMPSADEQIPRQYTPQQQQLQQAAASQSRVHHADLSEHQINTKYINDVVKSFRKRNPSMSVVYTKAFGLAIIIWMTLLFMRKMRFQALLTLTFLGSLQIYLVSRALYENVSFVSILDGIGNGLACVECFALLMLLLNKNFLSATLALITVVGSASISTDRFFDKKNNKTFLVWYPCALL